ncbi:hypothetical protein [Actinokineospora sp. HUAS TT18]|uniref:hypothetical protein n=1 Tax=Actinokineospora sp. HUAS TT18 TaxID=3447451 RepID=UPI003F51F8B6
MLTVLASLASATCSWVDDTRDVVWFASADGGIGSVPLAGGAATTHQVVASPVTGMGGNGATIVLAHENGGLSRLDPDDPTAAPTSVSRDRARYGQVAVSGAVKPTAAIVTGSTKRQPFPLRPRTALTLVSLALGTSRTVAVDGLAGVAIDGNSVYVGRTTGFPARGEIAQLRGTLTKTVATGLPAVRRIGLHDGGAVLLACHPGNRLSAIRPATGQVDTALTSPIPGTLIEAHGVADGRIAVLTSAAIALIDSLADLTRDPSIDPLTAPLFVGSWARLGFDLGTSGIGVDDIHFDVPDGPDAGFVSYARFDGVGDPVPLLVAGGLTGPHKVVMVETATNTVLAHTEFEITDHWTDQDNGPSGVYTTTSSFEGGGGWGGGPNTPQNLDVFPHNGTWRSMVLMVDTTSGRWPTDAPTMTQNQADILGHVDTGIAFNGDTRSARLYYEENSQFNGTTGLTLSVSNNQTFGPVNLPGSWTDYFAQKKDADGNIISEKWSSQGTALQTIISRSISDGVCTTADYTNIDVLIVVVFSPDATGGPPARFVWPHANDAREFLCGTNAMTDKRSFGYTFVPLDFAAHDGRQMHTTLSHELGHTLSLPDLYDFPEYSDEISGRLTSDWDMMAGSRDALPHYTLSNKMRMGWIKAAHLKLYNFQGSSAVAENTTLHACELGDPPAGRFKGIEIRLGNGWNYYVEYRAEQSAQISDDVPTDRRVVITDVTSETFTAPVARPPIIFVDTDIDGDGPILDTGTDLEEKDPGTQMDLKVEVVSTASDNAVVKVSYGANGKPEPGIRPWSGGPDWQSPDIEIRNDKATADPGKYFNVPWLGHDNTVVAKVKNSGDLLAKGVVVDFFVTEYSSGDGPWFPLGNDTKDVGPGATVEFTTGWNPAVDAHYCVIVRIRLYQDPGNLAVVDQNIYNNEARSNYTKFVSASASPSSRVGTTVLLANPFSESTLVFADVKKTHPDHHVYVDHQWRRVDGKGSAPIQVWDEALWGSRVWDKLGKRDPKLLWEIPNRLSVAGQAERPFEADCGARTLTGGVGLRVDAGRESRIELRAAKVNYVAGRVVRAESGLPVTSGGTVLIEVSAGPGKYFTLTDDVAADGTFAREFHNEYGGATVSVEVHYLGAYSAAPCTTGPVAI